MCYSNHPVPAQDLAASRLRALHSLTSAQVASVAAALRRMPAPWSLDEQEGYDGDLTLILTPSEHQAELSFALWRTPAGFHLCTLCEDEQVNNEVFASIEMAIGAAESSTRQTRHTA